MLSTLASTHQAHYKLKLERHQMDTCVKQLEDELWQSFASTTQFQGLITDLETAFSAYVKTSIGAMPGLDVVVDARIRPDLSKCKINQPGLSGELIYLFICHD